MYIHFVHGVPICFNFNKYFCNSYEHYTHTHTHTNAHASMYKYTHVWCLYSSCLHMKDIEAYSQIRFLTCKWCYYRHPQNPGAETYIFLDNKVNIMFAEALATGVFRSSANMVLNLQNKQYGSIFNTLVNLYDEKWGLNTNICSCFITKIITTKVYLQPGLVFTKW